MLHLFWKLITRMSAHRACSLGRALSGWLGPKSHRHAQLKKNLRLAFPAHSAAEIELLAQGVWKNLGAVMAEAPHLSSMTVGGANPSVHVSIDAATRPILDQRQPAVYVSAHLANWEIAALTIARLGVPLSVVYGAQRNPALEALIQDCRGVLGCRLVEKSSAMRRLVGDIGEGRSVGLLVDQRVDSGVLAPFFGILARTTTSPARLALKLGCPLVPVQVERLGDACFRTVFHPPLPVNLKASDAENILQLTTQINGLFETWIRLRPEQWLCLKRRWPVPEYAASTNNTGA